MFEHVKPDCLYFLYEGYGLSETCGAVTIMPLDTGSVTTTKKSGSIGPPTPGVQMKVCLFACFIPYSHANRPTHMMYEYKK